MQNIMWIYIIDTYTHMFYRYESISILDLSCMVCHLYDISHIRVRIKHVTCYTYVIYIFYNTCTISAVFHAY